MIKPGIYKVSVMGWFSPWKIFNRLDDHTVIKAATNGKLDGSNHVATGCWGWFDVEKTNLKDTFRLNYKRYDNLLVIQLFEDIIWQDPEKPGSWVGNFFYKKEKIFKFRMDPVESTPW